LCNLPTLPFAVIEGSDIINRSGNYKETYRQMKNKTGIYMWLNKKTHMRYIGSSIK